jgi:hypothetical protein
MGLDGYHEAAYTIVWESSTHVRDGADQPGSVGAHARRLSAIAPSIAKAIETGLRSTFVDEAISAAGAIAPAGKRVATSWEPITHWMERPRLVARPTGIAVVARRVECELIALVGRLTVEENRRIAGLG